MEQDKTIEKKAEATAENKEFVLDEMLKDPKFKSQYDKKVNDLLEGKKTEWHENWKNQAESEKQEAERLAKLSAEEKLVERENKLKAREQEQNKKELVYQTKELLQKENLPLSFADVMVGTDTTAEEIKTRIEELKSKFAEEVENKVKQSLAGNPPIKQENKNSNEDALRRAMKLSK